MCAVRWPFFGAYMKYVCLKLCALLLSACSALSPLGAKALQTKNDPTEAGAVSCAAAVKPPFHGAEKAFRITELLPSLFQQACIPVAATAKSEQTQRPKTVSTPTMESKLCVGGQTFGVRLFTEGVLVVSVNAKEACHPAYDGGVRAGDLILSIGGKPVKCAREATQAILDSGGRALEFVCKRNEKNLSFTVTPVLEPESGHYKAGIWIKDTAAGIGTVTFFDPQSGYFGGLGHGICDTGSGTLIPIAKGTVTDAKITEIVRGQAGKPGELRGFLKNDRIGALLSNTDCGVFGILTAPKGDLPTVGLLPKGELKCGKAVIRCALGEAEISEYEITISDIDRSAKGSKCFSIHIEDPALLEKTGGIVQGMSGSPIIQNGKLVGAVTHVLINDPTTGYGIFIENMLSAVVNVNNNL